MSQLKFYLDGTNGTPVDGEVSIDVLISKEGIGKELGKLKFRYSDAFFLHSACSYDHELAVMSLGLTMSAFTYKGDGDKHTRAALHAIGCDDRTIQSEKFGNTFEGVDSCGYIFGTKRLPDGNYLVPVVIRSHRYGGEWVSNAHAVEPAFPDHAAGFKIAADGVYDALMKYVSRRGLDRNKLRIWVCGYSRGGAVANLLGARLTFESGIGKDNIFVYSFATPVTVYDRASLFTDNIFNIISEMDVVPRMPLRYWGLGRYGTDMILPCKARRGAAEYMRLLGQMQGQFAQIMQALGVDAAYVPLDDQERALDLLFDYIDDLLNSPEKYRDGGYQQLAMDFMQSKMHGDGFELKRFLRWLLDGNEEMADELCSLIDAWHELSGLEKMQRLGSLLAKRRPGDKSPATEIIFMVVGIMFRYAAKFAATKVTGGEQDYFYEQLVILIVDAYQHGGDSFILQQHWPEAYLAWLKAAPETDLFRRGSYPRESIK